MVFGKTKMEMKVGIFVFIGMVILIIFVLFLGNIQTWSQGQKVSFIFNFINGVKIGAPVRLAGVDVGEVKKIIFVPDAANSVTKVEVVCWVKNGLIIPDDSTVWVNTLGLLGEKYIEIIPGSNYACNLSDGGSIAGIDPIPMHEVSKIAKNIAEHLDQVILKIRNGEGTIGKLVVDDSLYQNIDAALKNKDGTIGRFMYDDSVYKEVEAFVSDLRRHPWKLFWKTKEKPERNQKSKE